jgi:D-alanine-D-alanine ligase
MHIVFLHNLQTSPTPEQAEFDTPETVKAIIDELESLGHQVTPLDAGGNVAHLVTQLEMLHPDLVLNTAEGYHGRGREGFYPGLLDQMEIPYTGSDAYVCTLTLDKQLTNLALAKAGILVPQSVLVTKTSPLRDCNLRFPVIAKPNFEGSSKGITMDSVCNSSEQLQVTLERLLHEYPNGILLEEYIDGRDVTVPFIEGVGVLEPAHYEFAGPPQKYQIYDFDLKQNRPDDVHVVCPADVTEACRKKLLKATKKAIEVLDVRDLGRVDFRVTPDGEAFLIEVNALPSLEPGAAIYLAAAHGGLKTTSEALEAILKSALKRRPKRLRPKAKKLRVGVVYNLKRQSVNGDNDTEAEFDSQATVDALCKAVEENGFEVTPLEATPDLPSRLRDIDLAFNIAEGTQGRYREAQVPALLELVGVPCTGSESGSLAVCHDKALAKRLVRQVGVRTPPFQVMNGVREKLSAELEFPLLVKPVAEGSSKGVLERSVVRDETELREAVAEVVKRYHQPALVEGFLPGREFTVGILGEKKLRVLPIMEILFHGGEEHPIYSFQDKLTLNDRVTFKVPADTDAPLKKALEKSAKLAFQALGCRDVARIDFRLDGEGHVNFIECNPLPGLSPGFSDLCVLAEAAGHQYRDLVGQIMAPAVRRLKKRKLT